MDNVNHPKHYAINGIEAIDIIKVSSKTVSDPYHGYLQGNILKYMLRWPNKNGLEDLKKAEWYLKRLISEIEVSENEQTENTGSIMKETSTIIY